MTRPRPTHRVLGAIAVAVALVSTGCTTGKPAESTRETQDEPGHEAARAQPASPQEAVAVLPATTPQESALAVSQALFASAPLVVVLADDGHARAAAESALAWGAPLLPAGDAAALATELSRLGTESAVTFGRADLPGGVQLVAQPTPATTNSPAHQPSPADVLDVAALDTADAEPASTEEELNGHEPAEPRDDVLLLTTGAPGDLAAVATARAAGAGVHVVPTGDPRADHATVAALAGSASEHVLALGPAFGDPTLLAQRLAVARTGVELPGGGQTLFPGRRLVALYGHPGSGALGVLGEQPVTEAVARAKETAALYQPLSDRPIVPAFEVIVTVASEFAGPDGNYSTEVPAETFRPWIDAAREAGVYVVLDLQPGTTDFLTQAKQYESLLVEPHVGLALDPEWRLKPGQRHLTQIGSVPAAEVNEVSAWLATLTRERNLPQKLLVLHQFRLAMVTGREALVTTHDEVAVLVHADGHGTPGEKYATWDAVRAGAPAGTWWGWKNFYDEDRPTLTPEQTYQVSPVPDLVTYQ